MTTTTPYIELPTASWTEIAAGNAFSKVTLQLATLQPCHIAVRTAVPGSIDPAVFKDYIVLWQDGDASVTIELAAADKIFGRGQSAMSGVRSLRVSV